MLTSLLFHAACTRDKGGSANDAGTEHLVGTGGDSSGTGGGNSGTGGDGSGTGGGSSGTGGASSGTDGGSAGAGGPRCEPIGSGAGCRSDSICCSGHCGPYGCYEVDAAAETNDASTERTEGTGGSGAG